MTEHDRRLDNTPTSWFLRIARCVQQYLEVVLQGVADEHSTLQYRRHFLLALAQAQTTLEMVRLDAAHESAEVRHALVGSHVLVVADRRSRPFRKGDGRAGAISISHRGFGSRRVRVRIRFELREATRGAQTSTKVVIIYTLL